MDEAPEKIAILGAGPIGLEAALYGRFLGYDVTLFEHGEVAESVRQWGHVRMFSPFSMNSSPLGLAALEGQDTSYVPPRPDALLRGNEWRDAYLLPLAQSDLLADSIRTQTSAIAIGRSECRKHDAPDREARVDRPFRILTRRTGCPATAENEQFHTCDIVIDTTGTYGNSNGLGPDGTPARGETAMGDRIAHGIPNHATDADALAGKRLLVVGCGYSAATTLVELSRIAEGDSQTHVTWLVRRPAFDEAPMRRIADDRLAARDLLADQINQWAATPPAWLTYHPRCWIESFVELPSGRVAVHWEGESNNTEEFDHVIANVGFRPNREIYRELQVHECYATEGPIALAVKLLASTRHDCLDQIDFGDDALCTTEPDFFILGAKSFGRSSQFLFQTGLLQIRDAFRRIGGRAELDLYATIRRIPT